MKFCKKQKLLFIHIPKCAGTSIFHCFDMQGFPAPHASALEIKSKAPEFWSSFLKFATIRNPWETELSSYFYKMSSTVANAHPEAHLEVSVKGFSGFLEKGGAIGPGQYPDRFKMPPDHKYPYSMMRYLTDEQDKIILDEILMVENLEDDINNMCQKHNLGLVKKLEKTNDRFHLHYSHYYTKQWMIDFVYKKNEDYIKHFKYKFENEN